MTARVRGPSGIGSDCRAAPRSSKSVPPSLVHLLVSRKAGLEALKNRANGLTQIIDLVTHPTGQACGRVVQRLRSQGACGAIFHLLGNVARPFLALTDASNEVVHLVALNPEKAFGHGLPRRIEQVEPVALMAISPT
ncbi:MAG: hypothetical protein GEV03_00245 [Streptosporangiales bacterium]|nr:hypothetical protein [Streptosporangiales bacterium]